MNLLEREVVTLTKDQKVAILRLAIDGAPGDYTDAEVADALGATVHQVRYFLRREGIRRPPGVAAYTRLRRRSGEPTTDYS